MTRAAAAGCLKIRSPPRVGYDPAVALTYKPPSGEELRDDALDELVRRIRKGGASYWNVGAGEAAAYFGERERSPRIVISFVPRAGFHLVYHGGSEHHIAAHPARPPAKPKWVEIDVCGEPTPVSTAQCVSREEAEAVLRHFAQHRTRYPALEWAQARSKGYADATSRNADRVKKIVAEALKVEPGRVTEQARIAEDLGADGFDVAELFMALEDELRIEIPAEAVQRAVTVADVIAAVDAESP
jgi:acyl carrier protein